MALQCQPSRAYSCHCEWYDTTAAVDVQAGMSASRATTAGLSSTCFTKSCTRAGASRAGERRKRSWEARPIGWSIVPASADHRRGSCAGCELAAAALETAL